MCNTQDGILKAISLQRNPSAAIDAFLLAKTRLAERFGSPRAMPSTYTVQCAYCPTYTGVTTHHQCWVIRYLNGCVGHYEMAKVCKTCCHVKHVAAHNSGIKGMTEPIFCGDRLIARTNIAWQVSLHGKAPYKRKLTPAEFAEKRLKAEQI